MAKAEQGDTVKVHYTGKFEDGEVFDTSEGKEPLEFTIGEGRVIPGFEHAVEGMETGEKKSAEVPASEGYGPHHKELVAEVNRQEFPEHIDPKKGQQLQVPQQDGKTMIVTVTDVDENKVTLDGNHPLAGKDIKFDIELVDVHKE